MTTQEITIAVAGILGGGLVATIVSIVAQHWSARRATERAYLADALRHVYGPVFRLLTESRDLLALAKKVEDAASEHFGGNEWPESIQEKISQQMSTTIDVQNKYCAVVAQKVDEVIKIANDNWFLIDVGDYDVYNDMRRERHRSTIESATSPGKGMPFMIRQKLGTTSFYKEEWASRIESRYRGMMSRYRKLSGS